MQELRQEDCCEFGVSLGYRVRHQLKKQRREQKLRHHERNAYSTTVEYSYLDTRTTEIRTENGGQLV